MPAKDVFANDFKILFEPDLDKINELIQAIRNILQNHEAILAKLGAGIGGMGGTGDGNVDTGGVGSSTGSGGSSGPNLIDLIQDVMDDISLLKKQNLTARDLIGSDVFDNVQVIMDEVKKIGITAENIFDTSEIELARELAQQAANAADAARQAALELLSSVEAVRDEVEVFKTAAETAASNSETSMNASAVSAENADASAAQALISQNASATSALTANQAADASVAARDEALTYSTLSETYSIASQGAATEAIAARDIVTLGAGALANSNFEHERSLISVEDVFPFGWERSNFNLASEWEKLGFSAPAGTTGETPANASQAQYGWLTQETPEWAISKTLRVVDVTDMTIKVQAWIGAMDIPGTITRNSSTETFTADDDVLIRITCYDVDGDVIAQTPRQKWSDSLSQYQHDENGLTGVVVNATYTLEWDFVLPVGTDEVLIELCVVDGGDTVAVFGASDGNPHVRLDNFDVTSNGVFYDITGGGKFAREQARAAVTARNQAEAFATDSENWANASEASSVVAQTARDEANSSAAAAATSETNAQSFSNDALAYSLATQKTLLIATAQNDFSKFTDVAPDGAFTFDTGTMLWESVTNATLTNPDDKALRVTATGADAVVRTPVIDFPGIQFNKIQARIKIITGTLPDLEDVWISYTTGARGTPAGHEITPLFASDIGGVAGDTISLLFDVTQSAEAAEWAGEDIQHIYLFLNSSASFVYEIDFFYVLGEAADANYKHAQASIASAAAAEASETLASSYASAADSHRLAAETSESNASVSEGNAATSATNASGSAASALAYQNVTARISSGTQLLKNPIFLDWPNTYPTGMSAYALTGGSVAKVTGRYGNAVQFTRTSAVNLGIYLTWSSTGLDHTYARYMVVEAEVELVSGIATGSGILLQKMTAAGAFISSFSLPMSAWRLNGDTAFLSQVIDCGAIGTFGKWEFYLMSNYAATMGAAQTSGVQKWHKISLRAATEAEITALTVVADIAVAVGSEQSARIAADGSIEAKYGVKVDVNGHVSGFGLISTANNAAPFSEFSVNADSFKVAKPSLGVSTPQTMFQVGTVAGVTKMTVHGNVVADGSLTANSLNVGISKNVIYNSDGNAGPVSWRILGNTTGAVLTDGTGIGAFHPDDQLGYYLTLAGSPASGVVNVIPRRLTGVNTFNDYYPVKAGQKYELHARLSAHRCNGVVAINWYTAAMAYITSSAGNTIVNNASYGPSNQDYPQSGVIATAPPNAAFGLIFINMSVNGRANPYLFINSVFFGEATPYQAVASVWAPAPLTMIDGTQVKTGNLQAISATLGAVNISAAVVGSLIVDTINLAGNSVSVMSNVATDTHQPIFASDTVLATLNITSLANTKRTFKVFFYVSSPFGSGYKSTDFVGDLTLKLKRGATTILTRTYPVSTQEINNTYTSLYQGYFRLVPTTINLFAFDTAGSASATYTITAAKDGTTMGGIVYSCTLLYAEVVDLMR